jgi:hypothetical protein
VDLDFFDELLAFEFVHGFAKGVLRSYLHVAVGSQKWNPVSTRIPAQVRQEVHARAVGVVQIVEHEGNGPLGGDFAHEAGNSPEKPLRLLAAA